MIKVDVDARCHDCGVFEAEVLEPTYILAGSGEVIQVTDTIVQCKHRSLCRRIEEYIRNENNR